MARLPRFILPGQPQHVIVRGNNRDPIFAADQDYRFCLDKLRQACVKHTCEVHAYVLMTNHAHLLITPRTEEGIGKVIQMVGRYYVRYFNCRYQRTGTLWEGRYRASLIDTEQYLLVCMRYIELNPVRAGMTAHPAEYPWSSYRFNALGHVDPLVTAHDLYVGLGRLEPERQAVYRRLFHTHIPDRTVEEIREATNKAWVLGSDRFKEQIGKRLTRRGRPFQRGGDHRSPEFRQAAKSIESDPIECH